jgi:hypothetical protein
MAKGVILALLIVALKYNRYLAPSMNPSGQIAVLSDV